MAPGADQELVAWSMVHRDQSSVAVVHADGTFAGLIPPHRMIAVLLAEHDEDLARLGGYLAGTTRARRAAEEAVPLATVVQDLLSIAVYFAIAVPLAA